MISEWNSFGIGTKFVQKTKEESTCLSVLPVYVGTNGKRGIYFCSGSNKIMNSSNIFPEISTNYSSSVSFNWKDFGFFHFGYPHLCKLLRGSNLASLMMLAQEKHELITSLDINCAEKNSIEIVSESFSNTDILHGNLHECSLLLGDMADGENSCISEDKVEFKKIREIADSILSIGCCLIVITLGPNGAFLKFTSNEKRFESFRKRLPVCSQNLGIFPSQEFFIPSFILPETGSEMNTIGAGDTFVGALLVALSEANKFNSNFIECVKFAHSVAGERISGVCHSFEDIILNLPNKKILKPTNENISRQLGLII